MNFRAGFRVKPASILACRGIGFGIVSSAGRRNLRETRPLSRVLQNAPLAKDVPTESRLHGWLKKAMSPTLSRRLCNGRLAALRCRISCRYLLLRHIYGQLTRGHDRRLRVHECHDARLQSLGQALEPVEPSVGGRAANLEEPRQSRAALVRPDVEIDGKDPLLVLHDGLSDHGIVGFGKILQPVAQLPLQDFRLNSHPLTIPAIEFD